MPFTATLRLDTDETIRARARIVRSRH